MKKLIIALAVLIIAGCGSYTSPGQIEQAFKLCEKNDGLASMYNPDGNNNIKTVNCKNGAIFHTTKPSD